MTPKHKLAIATVLIAFALLAALMFSRPGQTNEPPLPNPNGLDDFIKAGTLLAGNESHRPYISIEDLRSMVATNPVDPVSGHELLRN